VPEGGDGAPGLLGGEALARPGMVRRWVGTGMIEGQRSFRRIKGCKDMAPPVAGVCAEVARRLAEEEGEAVTPHKHDQAAA
jgi:hypothetical protein